MKDTVMKDYGEDVFSEKAIRAFLPKAVAAKLLATMRDGKPLDPSIADAVAAGMKDWAVGKGAAARPRSTTLSLNRPVPRRRCSVSPART